MDEIRMHDVVQFTENHKWVGCFGAIVEDKKCKHPKRYMVGVPVPEQGVAFIYDDGSNIRRVGTAALIMKERRNDRRASKG